MEIAGLPLHPLVVHSTVVLTPLAVLTAWALALRPSWRWLTRWPAVALAALSVVSVLVARQSGEDLLEARPGLAEPGTETARLMQLHEDRSFVVLLASIGLLLLVVAAARLLGGPSALASGRGARESAAPWVERSLAVALLAVGAVVLVWLTLTGHTGASAVWKI